MKKNDGPLIELGQVYQRLKKGPQTRCTVMSLNDEGLVLKEEESEATHAISRIGLPLKFRLVGKHVSRNGEAVFVPLEGLASVPKDDTAPGGPRNESANHAPAKSAEEVKAGDAEYRARIDNLVLDLTREALLGDKFERVTVLKAKVQCPCGDVHEVKEESFPDFITSIARMCVRHDACHKTNVLPGLHEDRIDPKGKPANGEASAS